MSATKEDSSKDWPEYERPPIVLERRLPDSVAEEAEDKRHQKRHRSLQTWFNLLLVLFTALTASVAIWQGSLTQQSIEVAARQAKASEDANKLAREAFEANQAENKAAREESERQSKAALDASIRQMHLDQRAWVAVSSVVGTPEVGKPWSITVEFKNTGKTPAIDVMMQLGADTIPIGREPNYSLAYMSQSRAPKPSKGIFLPGATQMFNHRNSVAVSPELINALRNQTLRAYIFGQATYRDIFGRKHWTKFCFYLRPLGDTFVYTIYANYNSVDKGE